MPDTNPAESKTRKPRTRWVYALLVVGIATGVLGRIYLNPAHYIPIIEAALEEATGLPASVQGITLEPGETTIVTLSGITLGDSDFHIETDRVVIELMARPLLQRMVRIRRIDPGTIVCTLPDGDADAYERLSMLAESLSQPVPDSVWEVSVDEIQLDVAQVIQNGIAAAEISGSSNHLLSDDGEVRLAATLHRLGLEAEFWGEIGWTREEKGGIHLRGKSKGTRWDVTSFGIADMPAALVDFQIDLGEAPLDSITAELTGSVYAASEPALDGTFSAAVHYAENTLTMSDMIWNAPGVRLQARLTRTADGVVFVTAPVVDIYDQALDDLIAVVDSDELVLAADADAHLSGTDLALTWAPDADVRVTGGRVVFSGIGASLNSGEVLTHALKGDLDIRDNVIYIRELKDRDLNITGTVTPDAKEQTVALDLQGTVALSGELLRFLGQGEEIEDISGLLELDRITGTFGASSGVPDDLIISGKLSGGLLVFLPDTEFPPLDDLEARFTTDKHSIYTIITGRTPKSGVAEIEGAYTFADHTWDGTATFDVHAWVAPFIASEKIRGTYGPMLAEFGSPTVQVRAELPYAASSRITLGLCVEGTPGLSGEVMFDRASDGRWALGDVTAKATLPLDNLDSIVFAEVTGSGAAQMEFTHRFDEGRFRLDANLTACMLTAGEHIEKRAGDEFTAALMGDSRDAWTLDTLDVDCLGKTVTCEFEDGRLRIPQTTVGLASWQGLLPDDATATGYVTGTFDGATKEWALSLDGAGLAINSELAVDSVTGSISIQDGTFTCRELHVLGAQSDFVLTAGMVEKGWEGSLRGSKIDLNALREFQRAYKAFRYPETDDDTSADGMPEEASPGAQYWDKPFIGTFDVTLDRLYLGRGSVSNVRAVVQAEPDAIRFSNLRVQPDAGSMTGQAAILPNDSGTSDLALNLTLDRFNAQVLDDMFYEETRGLNGSVSGQLEFQGPMGGMHAMMAAGNGRATFTATKGSFGKMGFATKLLTALKTVNLINLRLPSLKDKGLTYRTFEGTAVMKDGVLRLQNMLLEDTSYAMEMGGTLDYARDATDFLVFVRVLESVTNLASKIPGLKQVAEMTTKRVGVNVRFSGSPWDMQSNVTGGDGIVGSTVGTGEKAIKGVGTATKKVVKKILNPRQ